MQESKKSSLVRTLLQQEIASIFPKTRKNPVKTEKIIESPRKSKQDPPRYFIGTGNPKGASVYMQPLPPSPKYKTLAFISYSGKTTFYESERSIGKIPMRIIKNLSKLSKEGELEDYIESKKK